MIFNFESEIFSLLEIVIIFISFISNSWAVFIIFFRVLFIKNLLKKGIDRELINSTFEELQEEDIQENELVMIKKLVEKGVGVALVPKLSAAAEIGGGRLAALSVKEMKLERKLNIVYRRNSDLSHAAKAFLQVAKNLASKNGK